MALSQTSNPTITTVSHAPRPSISADRPSSPSPPPQQQEQEQQQQQQQQSLASTAVARTAPSSADTALTRSTATDQSPRSSNYKRRQSALSISSSKPNRSGLFTFAALARDKTTNAIASLSEPSVRTRKSSNSLYRASQTGPISQNSNSVRPSELLASTRATIDLSRIAANSSASITPPNSSSASSHSRSETLSSPTIRHSLLETNPPSQAYSNTPSDTPAPIAFVPPGNHNKMHQTSSRLLRMTTDDRPFTRVCSSGGSPTLIMLTCGRISKICLQLWWSACR
jgi:hypothetical protein